MLFVFSGRLAYFFRSRITQDRFSKFLDGTISFDQLKAYEQRSPLIRMGLVFFDNREKSGPVLQEILDRQGAIIKKEMEQGLGVLSFIGTSAPLLGLLGTITGLMDTFGQIEQRGSSVDLSFLSGGIWEAMITTAFGLVTALCATCCAKWFEHISSSRLHEISLGISVLIEKLRSDILGPVKHEQERSTENVQ
jgi:biopolymer transport protein ExbB/TolQ